MKFGAIEPLSQGVDRNAQHTPFDNTYREFFETVFKSIFQWATKKKKKENAVACQIVKSEEEEEEERKKKDTVSKSMKFEICCSKIRILGRTATIS